MKIIWNYLKKQQQKKIAEENEKKILFSQTYILYDDAGVVKLTFVSELRQYVNIYSQFTIFSEKRTKI